MQEKDITIFTYQISCIFCGKETGTLKLDKELPVFDQKRFGIEDSRCSDCEKKYGKFVV